MSLTLSVLLLVLPACVEGQVNSLEKTVDEILSPWNNNGSPGAAVAYIDNGELVFKKAYGVANLEHQIAWTTRTLSDLGSVSKQFTGFALAMLAEQGRLGLDDNIRLHLTGIPDSGQVITLRNLFHHTSGLREIYETLFLINRKPGDVIFQEDAQTLVRHQTELQFQPGSRYLYNNTEYMLLADMVEAVTGQQFHHWMGENIFSPLSMNDTVIMHRQGQVIPRVATSYVRDADGMLVQRYDNSTLQGGGGIYSTVEDMAKWLANFSRHYIGSEETVRTLTESGVLKNGESLNYGLGIRVDQPGGKLRWSHSGSSAGYRSMLVYLPEVERGFIFLTGTPSNGTPYAELTRAFLGDVLPVPTVESDPKPPSVPEAVPVESPESFTGKYFSDELEVFYSVGLNNDTLRFSHRWLGEFEMHYLGGDKFSLLDRGGTLTFRRDAQHQISGFIFDNDRTIGVEFRRMEQERITSWDPTHHDG